MSFDDAQEAGLAWMRTEPRAGRWVRFETEPKPRVLLKESRDAEWVEFWPVRDPRLADFRMPVPR